MQAGTSSGQASSSRTGILKARQAPEPSQDDPDDFFPEEDVDEGEASQLREQARVVEEEALGLSSGEDNGDLYEDPHGSMYSGPLATSVPTSMTHMRRRASRSRSRIDRSDVDSDAASGLMLAPSSKSRKKHLRKLSISSRRHRRGSQSSAKSDATGLSSIRPGIPTTAVESASSSGSEDEEGGKKPHKRGMLSAWFGSKKSPGRPSLERAGSSASIVSRDGARSARNTRRRKLNRRRSSSFGTERAESEYDIEEGDETEINEDDPYGLYGSSSSSINTTSSSGSGSSASSDDAKSHRRRRRGTGAASMFMPSFGGADPVFGEGEEDDDAAGSGAETLDEDEPFFLDEITAFRQTIYIADEDLQLLFQGWGEKTYKTILWSIGCILSFGILSLLGKWIPEWWLNGRGKDREFGRASKIVVKTSHGTTYVVPIKKMTFANPVAISTVFPATSEPPPTSRNESLEDEEDEVPLDKIIAQSPLNGLAQTKPSSGTTTPVHRIDSNGTLPQALATSNGTQTPADQGSLKTGKEAKLKEYKYVDFRYYRFLLHPISGNFHMSR